MDSKEVWKLRARIRTIEQQLEELKQRLAEMEKFEHTLRMGITAGEMLKMHVYERSRLLKEATARSIKKKEAMNG